MNRIFYQTTAEYPFFLNSLQNIHLDRPYPGHKTNLSDFIRIETYRVGPLTVMESV